MTFSSLEKFKKNQTIELYEFRQGPNYWRYTSADSDQVYGAFTYIAALLSRSEIRFSAELQQDNVRIRAPRNVAIAERLTGFPIGASLTVKIAAFHRGQLDQVTLWNGRFVNIDFKGAEAELRFESITTSRREQGIRRTAGPGCSHTLYDQTPLTCLVIKTLFKTTGILTTVSGATIKALAFDIPADGWFNGGFVEWLRPDGIQDSRAIDTHLGDTLTLRAPLPGLLAGFTVNAYPGCDHTLADCLAKFNNHLNYGGFPFFPNNNPFKEKLF